MSTSHPRLSAIGLAVVGFFLQADLARAQQDQQLERVEITGSAIKRIDAETAVPVTVLRMDDLRKEGISSVEQVLSKITASQSQFTTVASVGGQTGAASFADIRGLGQNKTLILLNGRRIANSAVSGAGNSSAPDLNAIPFAALQRVEVLRDGASALYGTDAIGGVINFITRREFTGGVVTAGTERPQHGAGKQYDSSLTFGTGNYETDRFNLFGVIGYQKQDRIAGSDRTFAARSLKTSPTTFPGQYNQGGNVENPLFPGCNSPSGIPLSAGGGDKSCGQLYARSVDQTPDTERASAYLNGSAKLATDTRLNVEYFISRLRSDSLISGVPYGALAVNPGTPYYPGDGITPLPTSFTLDPAYDSGRPGALPGAIRLRWRDQLSGGREDQDVVTQQRLVSAIDGTAAGWDYQGGLSYNENHLDHNLVGGYTDGTLVTSDILNGIINPFSLSQTAAGAQAIANAAARGTLYTARGQVYQADGKASRELGDYLNAGRPVAIAVGAEIRHEKYGNIATPFAASVVSSTGFSPDINVSGQRSIAAAYTELNVPVFAQLDLTGSVRYDHYSDFGSTTNPKASFRYQPMQQLLFRGSYSTGFRAPALFELHSPQTYGNAADNLNDPVRCPGGNPIAGVSRSDNCGVQFLVLTGGNAALQPEKSKNVTAGVLFEPTHDAKLGADFFWIKLRQSIGTLQDTTVFDNPTKYAGLFHRAPDGSLATDGSQCPGPSCGYVSLTDLNLGDINTSGVDLTGSYRLRTASAGTFNVDASATYIRRYDYQLEPNGQFFSNDGYYGSGVGTGAGGVIFRWQTALSLDWTQGPFGLGIVNRYKTGYVDQNAGNEGHHVASYTIFDVYGSWRPSAASQLIVGVRNLLDREPPYSNQTGTFQVGYDPRYADPSLRSFYVRGTYTF